MRRLTLSILLGLGTLGLTFANPAQAKASWLSEALDNHPVQVTVAPTASYYQPPAYYPPAYYPPTYAPQPYVAPVPAYRAYAPVAPTVPVYRPAPYCPPAPVYAPRPVERYPVRADYRARDWHREHYGW